MTLPAPADVAAGLPLHTVGLCVGSKVVRVEPVSGLRSPRSPRSAFRATLADGRRVKLRRLRSPQRAEEVLRLLEEIDHPAFPKVERIDACLIEPWIEGRALGTGPLGRERMEEAGALLAFLHARERALSRSLGGRTPTGPHTTALRAQLLDLVRAEALPSRRAEEVAAFAAACDPGVGRLGLCHGDFAAENLIVDPAGALRAVDNEDVGIDAIEFDAAHAFYRWAPSPAERARFLSGYATRTDAGVATRAEPFWRACVLVRSAHIRAVRLAVDASLPLREIERLLAAGTRDAVG